MILSEWLDLPTREHEQGFLVRCKGLQNYPGALPDFFMLDFKSVHEIILFPVSFLQNCRPDRFFAFSRLILLSRAWVSGAPRGLLCFHNNKIPRR